MEIAYTRKTLNFFDYDLRRPRRMEFDVARTPALAALYDAGGAARLHALVEAGEAVLPIHPWETPDMCAYRNSTTPSLAGEILHSLLYATTCASFAPVSASPTSGAKMSLLKSTHRGPPP